LLKIMLILGALLGSNLAVEHGQKKTKVANEVQAQVRLIDEDLTCGVRLTPSPQVFREESLRQMLSDEEWEEYGNFILSKKYPMTCVMSLLQAATHSWGGGELPFGLVKTYNEFLEGKEGKKESEQANR